MYESQRPSGEMPPHCITGGSYNASMGMRSGKESLCGADCALPGKTPPAASPQLIAITRTRRLDGTIRMFPLVMPNWRWDTGGTERV